MPHRSRSTPNAFVTTVTVAVLTEGAGRAMTVTAGAAELALLFVFDVFVLLARTS